MTAMGLGLTIFLFATAALLNWGASFASQSVTDQLTPQKIMFPAPDSEGLNALPAPDKAAVEKYAGQQVTTGEQARVYATNYIGVHVKGIAGGKTYSEVSGEALGKMAASKADPTNAALAADAPFTAPLTALRPGTEGTASATAASVKPERMLYSR
ncbi:MAG: hypothetical protein RL301_445, partial [Actinomycetota bacterium]